MTLYPFGLRKMKELGEIVKAFGDEEQIGLGSIVQIVLMNGLEINYDSEKGIASIVPAEKISFGMPKQQITGKFSQYNDLDSAQEPVLEFEEHKDRYYFSVMCSQISDYKVLSPPDVFIEPN